MQTGLVLFAVLLIVAAVSPVTYGRPESDGTPTNPCAAMMCAANTRCVVKQVQCFTTPCPAQGFCEPIPTEKPHATCDSVRCKGGYKCVMQKVTCIRAPCPPIPQCVTDDQQ